MANPRKQVARMQTRNGPLSPDSKTAPDAHTPRAKERLKGNLVTDLIPSHDEDDDLVMECPDCGDRHDGRTTGTELCPPCQEDNDAFTFGGVA